MSKTVHLHVLKEEEKVLRDIEAKLKDQLNRLKVEELTLVNQLRSNEEDEAPLQTEHGDTEGPIIEVMNQPFSDLTVPESMEQEESRVNMQPLLDLDINQQQFLVLSRGEKYEEEEEEEEEEDDEEDLTVHDQLTAFMKRLERDGAS